MSIKVAIDAGKNGDGKKARTQTKVLNTITRGFSNDQEYVR